jgi:hypothetical protein
MSDSIDTMISHRPGNNKFAGVDEPGGETQAFDVLEVDREGGGRK